MVSSENAGVYNRINSYFVILKQHVKHIVKFELDIQEKKYVLQF
jgi:hypothetical protein